MTKVRYWSMDRLTLMIVKMLLNNFDCFMVIEGNRGLGKSTLAYEICKKIHRYFRAIARETGKKESIFKNHYRFSPEKQLGNPNAEKFLLYTQQSVINFFDKWYASGVADEMINVAFNREFWSNDQKNLIKLINMNRDHCNLLIACVPQFQNLDNQIKNLCKMRITVVRRGLCVIQTPNRTIYGKDKWDTANNERIERDWLKKGSGLPQYSKLNTFRGMMRFKDLSSREKKIYNSIKVEERNTIKTELGVSGEKTQDDPVEKAYQRLISGGFRSSSELIGFALGIGLTQGQLEGRLKSRLKKENKPYHLRDYYWDKKLVQKESKYSNFRSIQ